ncbi:unnamed protein product [Cunninghamella blakesleeana]
MTQFSDIPTWTEYGREILDIVCSARENNTSSNETVVLGHQLQRYKNTFLNLLTSIPKNNTHRQTLQAGTTFIKGIERKVNAEFIKEAIFLSDQLDINEYVASTLLTCGKNMSLRTGGNAIDISVLLYYDEQVYILVAIDIILKTIKDESTNESIRFVLHEFMTELMNENNDNSYERFVSKLLQTSKFIKQQEELVSKSGSTIINGNISSLSNAGTLGEEITLKRLERLTDQRIYIVQILYHIASIFTLQQQDIFAIMDILQISDLTDVTTPYFMTILLAAISPNGCEVDEMDSNSNDTTLFNNINFITEFHNKLINNLWKVPAVKSVIALQWCLFVGHAKSAYQQVDEFTTISESDRQQLIDAAIEAKAFEFLNDYILYFQQPEAKVDTNRQIIKTSALEEKDYVMNSSNNTDDVIDPTDFSKFNADIRLDFQQYILFELENIALGIIRTMDDVLRKLRYREEDTNQPTAAPLSTKSALSSLNEKNKNRDLEYFFKLLASIYRNQLDKGKIFWVQDDNELFNFIKRATDTKEVGTISACYDFFGSISTGVECANSSFLFFEANTKRPNIETSHLFSWGKLFATLQFYIPQIRDATDDAVSVLPADEEYVLLQFLNLLKQVILYSSDARVALWGDNQYRVRDSIIGLINCSTSTSLRASLFEMLAAFCTSNGGGVNGVGEYLSNQIWYILEDSNYFLSKRQMIATTKQNNINYNIDTNNNNNNNNIDLMLTSKQAPGFLQEIQLERNIHTYNETLSVLHLFGSAIHTKSKREDLISGFRPILSTLPSSLGQNTRTPGGEPYISCVIDDILINLSDQQYQYPGTRWQLTESCLKVMEKSIYSFDLRPIEELAVLHNKQFAKDGSLYKLNPSGSGGKNDSNLLATELETLLLKYVTHPGFSVIRRILSGGSVCKHLFDIISYGVNGVANKKNYGDYFVPSMIRTLRIIYRILQIQNSFCNILVPFIVSLSNRENTSEFKLQGYTFDPLPALIPLGDLLLCQANIIVQIAMLINCEDEEEICYLSTKVLETLSIEPKQDHLINEELRYTGAYVPVEGFSSKLANILNACKDASSIIYGIGERLEISTSEFTTFDDYLYDINNIPFWNAKATLDNIYNLNENVTSPCTNSSVRISILNLLLENTTSNGPTPSLAEFILGYIASSSSNSNKNNGTRFLLGSNNIHNETSTYAFRTILAMLQNGMIKDDDSDIHMDMTEYNNNDNNIDLDNDDDFFTKKITLMESHPILGEKCYQLIYRLCAKSATHSKTLRYLRNEEDYFYKQFKTLSARIEKFVQVENPTFGGIMVCPDGSRYKTDFFRLLSTLHQRAWLLKTLALELHYASGNQQRSVVIRLLNLLFGKGKDVLGSMNSSEQLPHGVLEQYLMKLLDIIQSLDFRWEDQLATEKNETMIDDFQPVFFINFRANEYQIYNERHCLVYDIRTIYSALRNEQLQLESRQQSIITEDDRLKIEKEMGNILQALVIENHTREIVHGRVHCLRAWKQVVQVALTECFDYFATERRESLIYTLLMTLLPKLNPIEGYDKDILKALSELVSTLVTRLSEKKQLQQQNLQPLPTTTVSSSSSSSFLSSTISSNLITSLKEEPIYRLDNNKVIQIFTGILDSIQQKTTTVAVRGDMYTSLVNILQYAGRYLPSAGLGPTPPLSINQSLANILIQHYNEILDTICNDACEGLGIWRTTAFTALNSIYQLTGTIDDHRFLSLLTKRNFIRYTIDMIRTEDKDLISLLEQEDASLLPMYIYEAKISLFTRIALKKNGAELLIENEVLEVLGQCEFIAAKPNTSDKDTNNILVQRYEQLLLPTLRFIVTLLCSIGRLNGYMIEMVESWVKNQQVPLINLLKQDISKLSLKILNEIKLVASIMYYLSCRPGFFKDIVSRNLNSIHLSMIYINEQFNTTDELLNRVIPTNDEERLWTKQYVSDLNTTSVFIDKSRKLVDYIRNYVKAYQQNAESQE